MKKVFFILTLAAVLRFWSLGNVPPSASLDEASIGYNAYSLLKTGGDEYGEFPILSHRAYDDYRRAIYLYLTIPSVALFGLNVVSVRLPAAILSMLTVLATYFLVKTLFYLRGVHPATSEVSKNEGIALLSAFLLAISPWHIYISRLGHESNAYLSFFIFGILFFLKGMRNKNKIKILVSMIFFTLSMVSYYSGQAFIPLFVLGLLFVFRKNLLPLFLSDKKTIIGFLIFLTLFVFVFKGVFSDKALIRFQGTSIFNSQPERVTEYALKRAQALEEGNFIEIAIYNRRVLMARQLIEGYLAHFNPLWLFTNSSAEPHKVPNMGLLYLWEMPFIIMGIIVLLFNRRLDPKIKKIIFLWFFLAPLPASIATQAPHAMRSYNFLPIWQIFAAFGLVYTLQRLGRFKSLTLFTFILLVLISPLTFYKNYFLVFPKEQSASFQYALTKTIPFVLENEEKYDKVIFSNKDNLYQSYMFFLFHSRYDPGLYQKEGGTKSGGFAQTHRFGKFEFRPIEWEKEKRTGRILYIGNFFDFPQGASPLFVGYYLNGKPGTKVVSNKL